MSAFFKRHPYFSWLLICMILFFVGVVFAMLGLESVSTFFVIATSCILMVLVPTGLIRLLQGIKDIAMSRKVKFEPKHLKVVDPFGYTKRRMTHIYRTSNGDKVTWGSVTGMLVVFFPIGIYYLILKLMHEKDNSYSNGVKMLVMGGAFTVLTAPVIIWLFIATFGDFPQMALMLGLPGSYFLIGIALLITGSILRHKGLVYEKYLILIMNYHVTKLDLMKSEFHTTYAKVTRQLNTMIELELLKNCYIYHKDREIIVPAISKKIALRCPSCSATTVLYSNEEHICAYCGGEL